MSRCLIVAAAAAVPRAQRRSWKTEWLWEVWHGHSDLVRGGCTGSEASWRILRFAAGALVDAADLRLEHILVALNRRSLAREPLVCLGALLLVFLALAAWTDGFRHSRLAASASYPDSQQLVLLSRPAGVLGIETAASMEQVWAWVDESKWFGNVAGFRLHGGTLEISRNFFDVLHTDAVPGGAGWRFLGRPVQSVRFLDPGSQNGYAGAIARLKHPADRSLLEIQLGKLANQGVHITATFLDERGRWPLYFAAVTALMFLAAGMVRARRTPFYLAFFAVKTALLLASVGLAWTEVASTIPIPVTGGVDVGTAAPLVMLLLLSEAFVLRWSLEDQAGRCPVCCRQVSMPVTVGSRSSLILDRPGVEFLCTRGHGTLRLSDLTTCTGEPYHWTPLDHSWQEVFAREKTA